MLLKNRGREAEESADFIDFQAVQMLRRNIAQLYF
jgi:hypothetical protein